VRTRRAARQDDPGQINPLLLTGRLTPDKRYDGILHRSGSDLILELERAQPDMVLPSVRGALGKLQETSTEAEICWTAAKEARRLTGFDRVKIYRFAPDWSGEVVAEARGDDVESYLGTHFPASDIPKQARELYTRKLLGYIPDVNYSPVPLLASVEGPPLDMSHCVLRSVSPIHLEYLRNMGVRATLTISLVIDGKLWGMIACHHGKPWSVRLRSGRIASSWGRSPQRKSVRGRRQQHRPTELSERKFWPSFSSKSRQPVILQKG